MTIKEIVLEIEIKSGAYRAEKLEELKAPQVMIDALKANVEDMKAGNLKVGGAVEKLDNEVDGYEIKKGRGGKQYIEFSDGTRYFPEAKYGRYIS